MKKCLIALLLLLLIAAAGCQDKSSKTAETLSLRVGVMPAVDSAPIFYADQKDLFAELDLVVTVEVYTNAMDRQSALISGGLDGAMTDVIALVN
ncbi:MAG: ABC transporter substrate-binding protein, partial [Eubacteriales bacterium]|nr:ABC transporter substrate-binding protein [Eubacteriales bacterium]